MAVTGHMAWSAVLRDGGERPDSSPAAARTAHVSVQVCVLLTWWSVSWVYSSGRVWEVGVVFVQMTQRGSRDPERGRALPKVTSHPCWRLDLNLAASLHSLCPGRADSYRSPSAFLPQSVSPLIAGMEVRWVHFRETCDQKRCSKAIGSSDDRSEVSIHRVVRNRGVLSGSRGASAWRRLCRE